MMQRGLAMFWMGFLGLAATMVWPGGVIPPSAEAQQPQASVYPTTIDTANTKAETRRGSTHNARIDTELSRAQDLERRGQYIEADQTYRDILTHLDPDHEEAYRGLIRLHQRHEMPRHIEAEEEAATRVGPGFRRSTTAHFVIYSNADASWTRQQASRLERCYDQWYRMTRDLGLRPLPLASPLICLLFEDHAAFAEFARTNDDVQESWIAGYYASKPNYVAFYNTSNGPAFAEAQAQMNTVRDRLASTRNQARVARMKRRPDDIPLLEEKIRLLEDYLRDESRRLAALARDAAAAKTIHEATHQLAFNTGVQSRYQHYPFWVTEGMATSFETNRPHAAFGPDREYASRRDHFDELLTKENLIPLSDLVRWQDVPDGREETADTMYHQAYALFTWLHQTRSDDLSQYLKRLASPTSIQGDVAKPRLFSAERQHRIFVSCFGEVDEVEQDWLRWENRHSSLAAVSSEDD